MWRIFKKFDYLNNREKMFHNFGKWTNISIAHILGNFFRHFESIFFNLFFEHVEDEFWKTNPRLVLQETPPHTTLGAFCPLRWNFCPLWWNSCPLWRNYRTLSCNTIYNGTAFDGFLVCGSRFTLRLNIAKSTNYIEKFFRQVV